METNYCIVPGCTSNSRVNQELCFFTLPKDEVLLLQWTTNMGISEIMHKPLSSRAHSKVCELHFAEKAFSSRDHKKLNREGIPTIIHQSIGILPENETIPLVAETQVSLADPSEHFLGGFLSRSYISKEEFVKEYKKFYYEKEEAKELYLQVLTELEKTVREDNVDSIKILNNLVDYISDVENQVTLRDFYDNVNNPIRNTNVVILACKYDKVNVLEYLFSSDSRILNNLSISNKRTIILPNEEDETHHNAFYYAVRSNNIVLLNTLINKWPNNYFAADFGKLDEILSRAYDELKLKNVPLSDEIEFFVEKKLINLRFFSYTDPQDQAFNVDVNNTRDRIDLMLEYISFLNTDYSNTEEVDEKFVFVAKSIAQNIHILKHQLKSTYDRLPWEEIEFCLVSFVSSHTKRQEINLFYNATLSKSKMLKYLENFATKLESEKYILEGANIAKFAYLPNIKRENVVENIISSYPQFEELYNDYQQIRDIHSLEKISNYIKLALSADPIERTGQLIITRVLQVIGEYLKNTLESPKLSNTTSELFLLSLPKNARKVIVDLRNSLSHVYSLAKRMEIEENADVNFFINIQNDTKKVGDVVNDILYNNKIKTIRMLLKKIINSESVDEIKEVIQILSNVELEKNIPENFKRMEHEKLEKLINELSETITDQTNYEKELFKNINKIINSVGTQTENIKTDYNVGLASLKAFSTNFNYIKIDHNLIRGMKFRANLVLNNFNPKIDLHNLKEITELSMKIARSAMLRRNQDKLDDIDRLKCEIISIAEFETGDIKWIKELREKLNVKCVFTPKYYQGKSNVTEEKYNEQLALKISELKNILSNNLLSGQSIVKLPFYKNDKKLQAVVEMLVLDIMSILGSSKHYLENNELFLDDFTPLLTGKYLRNHLAHDNALIDVLLSDPSLTIVLNATKLTEENIMSSKKKIGKFVNDDPSKLRKKYDHNLATITNQEKMFIALEEGNLESLHDCLKKGTDINARSINLWTTLHFAAKGPSLEVVKFIVDQRFNVNVKDINSQSPLHIAAAHGRKNIVEFFLKEADLHVDDVDNTGKTPLHIAAQNGHEDIVQVLLQNKANTVTQDIVGLSPLYYAIRNNHINVAKILMEKESNVDSNEAVGGFTPLHEAVECGHLELVNLLIKNKADVNAKNERHWTPLHAASYNGHQEIVNALILKGADINAKVINGCTSLLYAVESGNEKIVNILLQHGANVNAVEKTDNKTPLHIAAKDGLEGIVTTLLKNKADANIATVQGLTPLHLAVLSGYLEIVTALIKHGVNIHDKDKKNYTPLHHAAESGRKEIGELLIKNRAEINAIANNNFTPLHVAALNGHEDVTDLLIKNKAIVNAQDIKGSTPLHAAAMNGSKDVIDLLIKNKAEVNTRNKDGMTPLHIAALEGHADALVFLIENKAKVNIEAIHGLTPLHAAVVKGHKDIVMLLIKNKAKVNARGIENSTPLHIAVEAGYKEIVEFLVANGANVNDRSCNLTPLISAIKCNHKDIVNILISNGANVNNEVDESLFLAVIAGYKDIVEILIKNNARVDIKDPTKYTLLHFAVSKNHKEIVKILITKGVDVNSKSIDNTTPLHLAADEGYDEIAEILIENGANVNAVNIDGTPLQRAAGYGHNNVVKVLLNNGVKVNSKDNGNRTALELAASYGHLQVVKTLLQYKEVDINYKGNDDYTVLHIAAQENKLEVVKYLIEKGSNIHAKNASGSKPIHIAAREGCKDIIEFFLTKGSSLNDLGADNQTLLHYAGMKSQLHVINYLIAQGADVNIKDSNGLSPLHIAVYLDCKDVIEILLKNGAVHNAICKFGRKPLDMARNIDVIFLLRSIENFFQAVKRNSASEVQNYIKAGGIVNVKNSDGATALHYAAWKGYDGVVKILLENKANPNVSGKNGFTPLHYAAKFSYLKIVKTLLCNGAIYNAVSYNGKTPSNLSVDKSITMLFKLVSESFRKIKNHNSQVVSDLNKIKDIDTLKAIMCARNKENQTLVVTAVRSNFSKVEELKQISQGDVSVQIEAAILLFNQSNYQKALNIFKRVFENRKEILGADNPGTLDIQTYIARALFAQGAYKEALNIFEEIFLKHKENLGLYDKDTLNIRSMIALVLHNQGKDEEAFNIYQEVYEKQKEMLGPNHSDILDTQLHMALVLDKQGKYEEALNINRIVFERTKEISGANDPVTVSAQNNIAMVLANQGKYEEALNIYKEVFETKKVLFGINHAHTLRTFHNIAGVLFKQKKYSESLKAHQEVLNIRKNVLGPNHPETLSTQYNMANVLFEQGKWIGALKAYKEGFDQMKAVFGPSHPTVLDILKKIEMINMMFKVQGQKTSEILQHLQKDINIAAINGDVQTVQCLLKDGANVNDKDIDGRTPLHYAVSNGQLDVVDILLKNGADVTQVTNKGNNALHTATSKGYKKIVELLLQNVNQKKLYNFINAKTTAGGATSLHVAAKNGSLDNIMALLKRGAIYNIKNIEDQTPVDLSKDQNVKHLLNLVEELFIDAKFGNVEIISKLKTVKPGEFVAVTNVRNNQGKTLLQVAIANRHKTLVSQLLGILKKPDQNL